MQGLTRSALHLVPSFLVICVVSFGGPCVAQDVEVDAPPPAARGPGSVFAPSGYLELIAPVQDRVALKFYGFYIGELKAPWAQLDVHVNGVVSDVKTKYSNAGIPKRTAYGLAMWLDPP
jgi:hypothetical protein